MERSYSVLLSTHNFYLHIQLTEYLDGNTKTTDLVRHVAREICGIQPAQALHSSTAEAAGGCRSACTGTERRALGTAVTNTHTLFRLMEAMLRALETLTDKKLLALLSQAVKTMRFLSSLLECK